MNYGDVKRLIEEVMWRRLEDLRDYKRCPKCKRSTSMVKVYVENAESVDEFAEELIRWRCLNCLGLFNEELKGVESE